MFKWVVVETGLQVNYIYILTSEQSCPTMCGVCHLILILCSFLTDQNYTLYYPNRLAQLLSRDQQQRSNALGIFVRQYESYYPFSYQLIQTITNPFLLFWVDLPKYGLDRSLIFWVQPVAICQVLNIPDVSMFDYHQFFVGQELMQEFSGPFVGILGPN